MMGLADFFSNFKGNPGWVGKVQEASPLLMAFGQQLQTPRHMRDPRTLQVGVAQMQEAKEKRQQQAQQKAQREAIAKGVGELQQAGRIPGGLAEIMAAGDPEKVLPSLLDYMEPKDPQRYNMGNGILVDENGKEIYTADPEPKYQVIGNELLQLGEDGVKSLYKGAEKAPPNFRVREDGTYEYIPNSAADPEYIRQVSEARGDNNGITVMPDGTVQIGGTTATTNEAIKGYNAYRSITTGLEGFRKLVNELGHSGEAVIPGKTRDALRTQRRALQLQMKELFNLGVLNGPDLDLMDTLLVDPSDWTNAALDATGISDIRERTNANIDQLMQLMTELIEPKLQQLGQELPGKGQHAAQPSSMAPVEYNGKQYVQVNGQWYEVGQ